MTPDTLELTGHNLANGSSTAKRRDLDFYPTPPEATQALIDFLGMAFTNRLVWEPACGDGSMSRVFEANGVPVESTDLAFRGHGRGGVDFLTTDHNPDAQWIITNPPFNLSEAFIRRAIPLAGRGVAMLLKSQYWHAKKRLNLFREFPPSFVLPLTWRLDFLAGERGGNPTMECIWTVWEHPLKPNATIYSPLVKPTN